MNRQLLQDRLQKLQSELQQIDSIDADERQLLQSLISDINKLIDQPDTNTEQLTERLTDGIALFEAKHPQATLLMGQVVDALAKLGI